MAPINQRVNIKADGRQRIQSIQIETTSKCNMSCATCLKSEYPKVWQERDMDLNLFARIIGQLKQTKPTVHLQGWGEPLLQKNFLDYVKLLKNEKICTSFTTNGSVMHARLASELIESGLDGITFSMAGFRSATHDELRGEGSLTRVKNAITIIAGTRKRLNQTQPILAVSYILTPQTVKELPQAISWCRKAGIDNFVTVNLTQSGGKTQHGLRFLLSKEKSKEYYFTRILAHIGALPGKMKLDMQPFFPTLSPVCDKNPLNKLFISADGDVAPCVFLAPPVKGKIIWYSNTGQKSQSSLQMGNMGHLTLKEIWEGEKYRKFRRQFRQRKEYYDKRLGRVSYSLSGAKELEDAVMGIQHYFRSHPPPRECLRCAKIDGY